MPNFSSTSLHDHAEYILVPVITAAIGVFGLLSNVAAIVAVRYNPALRNSFGVLCSSHCIANMGILLVYTFWIAPVTIL
ncbi:hypothetical protein KIN20_032321 [Parelaphostrongylus tenuis]|uniref:7TM GPCR serpentine receptor class x (Srx) domain-containing protein n=1 Tax=Parelaphostrongylus tenuis TaxID=148309 RepID=A0AAD5R727_PARTN|nr:hypothetical protein KIN20_032321 [Parelaphostrongylus tenuis]